MAMLNRITKVLNKRVAIRLLAIRPPKIRVASYERTLSL